MKRKRFIGINPVEKALIKRDLERSRVKLGIKIMLCDDDQDATAILADSAYLIGMVAQSCVRFLSYDQTPWLRQLHGALRAIQSMCIDQNYSIQYSQKLALQTAIDIASEHLTDSLTRIDCAAAAWDTAKWLRSLINTHQMHKDIIPDKLIWQPN